MPVTVVTDKKGNHQVVDGHAPAPETGRTVTPSSIGENRGAQLGRDHTVAMPSTMIMPDGSQIPIVPPRLAATLPPGMPVPVVPPSPPAPPLYSASVMPAPAQPEAPAILAAPAPPMAYMPATPAAPAPQAAPSPAVRVSMHSKATPETKSRLLFRARYHAVLGESKTLLVLAWDNRFEHSDPPLFPFSDEDPVELLVDVRKGDLQTAQYAAVYMGLEFDDGPYTYFVLLKQ